MRGGARRNGVLFSVVVCDAFVWWCGMACGMLVCVVRCNGLVLVLDSECRIICLQCGSVRCGAVQAGVVCCVGVCCVSSDRRYLWCCVVL